LAHKLKALKLDLKKWNATEFGHISTKNTQLENDMLALDLVTDWRPLVTEEMVRKEQLQA
jgi:hypothetical protein